MHINLGSYLSRPVIESLSTFRDSLTTVTHRFNYVTAFHKSQFFLLLLLPLLLPLLVLLLLVLLQLFLDRIRNAADSTACACDECMILCITFVFRVSRATPIRKQSTSQASPDTERTADADASDTTPESSAVHRLASIGSCPDATALPSNDLTLTCDLSSRRILDEEDDLSEVQPDAVPTEVILSSLSLTYFRSSVPS
jgi:hypothetical protein